MGERENAPVFPIFEIIQKGDTVVYLKAKFETGLDVPSTKQSHNP